MSTLLYQLYKYIRGKLLRAKLYGRIRFHSSLLYSSVLHTFRLHFDNKEKVLFEFQKKLIEK
jgi:hypothetical protein